MIKQPIKKDDRWVEFHDYMRMTSDAWTLPMGSTVLIHIGKCGGRSVMDGIKQAGLQTGLYRVHAKKPIYRKDLKYIIVARGPIARLSSAFRWRYKLVVSDGVQKNKFEGEYDVLTNYQNLNTLAEALYYDNGEPNSIAQADIRKIHHIRETISFYLRDLLNKCHPSQIVAVLMQENLNDDIFRVFGYKNEFYRHSNPPSEGENVLSDRGIKNLMQFFQEDYEALIKLYTWGKIDRSVLIRAL